MTVPAPRSVVVACGAGDAAFVEPLVRSLRVHHREPVTCLLRDPSEGDRRTLDGVADAVADLPSGALPLPGGVAPGGDHVVLLAARTLVLGSLHPLFEALTSAPVAAVPLPLSGRGRSHRSLRHRLTADASDTLHRLVGPPELDAPGLHTGCIGLHRDVIGELADLLARAPELRHQVVGGEAGLLEVLIRAARCEVVEMPRPLAVDVQPGDAASPLARAMDLRIGGERLQLFAGASEVDVVHLGGPPQEWQRDTTSAAGVLWQLHATEPARRPDLELRALVGSGRVDEAVEQLAGAELDLPGRIDVVIDLASALVDRGRYAEAGPLLEEARERKPDSPAVHRLLFLLRARDDLAAGLDHLDRHLELRRRAKDLRAHRTWLRAVLGQEPAALLDLHQPGPDQLPDALAERALDHLVGQRPLEAMKVAGRARGALWAPLCAAHALAAVDTDAGGDLVGVVAGTTSWVERMGLLERRQALRLVDDFPQLREPGARVAVIGGLGDRLGELLSATGGEAHRIGGWGSPAGGPGRRARWTVVIADGVLERPAAASLLEDALGRAAPGATMIVPVHARNGPNLLLRGPWQFAPAEVLTAAGLGDALRSHGIEPNPPILRGDVVYIEARTDRRTRSRSLPIPRRSRGHRRPDAVAGPLADLWQRVERHVEGRDPSSRSLRVLHVGAFSNRNAGDETLLWATQRVVERAAPRPVEWVERRVRQRTSARELRGVLAGVDALVIGGGGLFFADDADQTQSGWQWDVPPGALADLDVPTAVVGVGVNHFGDADADLSPMAESLAILAERAVLFGLRDSWSLEAVRRALPPHLQDRPTACPCPTTVGAELAEPLGRPPDGTRRVALNVPTDRSERRYRDPVGVHRAIARAVRCGLTASDRLTVVQHCPEDRWITRWLMAEGVDFDLVDLSSSAGPEVIEFYARQDLVIGGRGHAQLIPFGARVPVIVLSSHEKSRSFAEDVGMGDLVVDSTVPDGVESLVGLMAEEHIEGRREGLAAAHDRNRALLEEALTPLGAALTDRSR